MTPDVITAAASIPLWVAACIFIAVIAARIVRGVMKTEDPESPYDL